jgi:4a-hydroxytetrahydrobiopterin dehydratase
MLNILTDPGPEGIHFPAPTVRRAANVARIPVSARAIVVLVRSLTMSTQPAVLSPEQIASQLKNLPGWQFVGNEIAKTYSFKNYYETMAFVNASAWISHATDHHPDLEVGYNKCKVRYSTHSAGGVTSKDVECAGRIEALVRG